MSIFLFLVFYKGSIHSIKNESILLKREPSEIDTMYELLKDDMLENIQTLYFIFQSYL